MTTYAPLLLVLVPVLLLLVAGTTRMVRHGGYRGRPLRPVESDWAGGDLPSTDYRHFHPAPPSIR